MKSGRVPSPALCDSTSDAIIRLLSTPSQWKEVTQMEYIVSFLISVVAGVTANYICKWLDEDP